jgi:hypothetical protein
MICIRRELPIVIVKSHKRTVKLGVDLTETAVMTEDPVSLSV